MRKLKDKHVFISFEQSPSGYKLARVLATMPCMHWYSCEENGINPWNISSSNNKHHFDRITPKGELPPTHDLVEKYMPNEKHYYKLFDKLFEQNGGADIINNGERVIYCTHSMPGKLLEYFPHSIIFNIIHDPLTITDSYVNVATESPAYVKHDGVVPEDNEYLKFLEILNGRKEDLTLADVWAFERKKKFYNPEMEEKLRKEVFAKMFSNSIFRKAVKHDRVFNTTSKFNYKEIKDWLDSKELT
jgi:hypothetical protein|tara:strand:+ start:134 stop:868 length:735 start_codon:yes stop_codon:yes gene_type:complete